MYIYDEKVDKIICFLDGNEKPYTTTHETKPWDTIPDSEIGSSRYRKNLRFNVSKKEDARL